MDCREFIKEYRNIARALRRDGLQLSLEDFLKVHEIRVLKQIAKSLEKLSEQMSSNEEANTDSIDDLF